MHATATASPTPKGSPSGTRAPDKYLTFRVGADTFAIPIVHIREVLQFEQITSIPMTPSFVRGVINLRGSVVPVIDLSVRFERSPIESGRRTCVVIVEVKHEANTLVIGVLVDQVNEVVGIDDSCIERAPTFGSSVRSEFMRGMGTLNGRFVVVLDVAHVLSVEQLATLSGHAA